jgi:hypothetical protein
MVLICVWGRPLIPHSYLLSPMINIVVGHVDDHGEQGVNARTFAVHGDLICNRSCFIRDALEVARTPIVRDNSTFEDDVQIAKSDEADSKSPRGLGRDYLG